MIAKKIVKEIGLLEKYRDIIRETETIRSLGRVYEVTGNVVFSRGPDVRLGEICYIERVEDESYILAEVVGFRDETVILSPLEAITGVYLGSRVLSTGAFAHIILSQDILGRVIDGMGKPLDRNGKLVYGDKRTLFQRPPNPLERPLIRDIIPTGIRAIDGFLSIGKGQRIGIFAGSGVGKSTLIGMIARFGHADVNVIGLVGERGREVAEFIENELGEHGLRKSVVVVASSNESPMHRVRAAYLVTTIAEYFRDQGKNVMLMMDSLTRLAMAQREVGLSAGEPATTKGYPPSVFSMMPELLERAGNSEKGSITGIYTVLVEGDDLNDPIADAARGILDGHIVLSRRLAARGQYPAVDVPESISRSMPYVAGREHLQAAAAMRELMSVYQENEDIINLGAYVRGANPVLDNAMRLRDSLQQFLRQGMTETAVFSDTLNRLRELNQQLRGRKV